MKLYLAYAVLTLLGLGWITGVIIMFIIMCGGDWTALAITAGIILSVIGFAWAMITIEDNQ